VPYTPKEKKRALTRLRRIQGQTDALARALEVGTECSKVLQQLAAIRGAVNGLMAEVLESHLREEFGDMASNDAGIQQAITLVRSYLK
jgi:DNA-binding FrmR family transcriptional regulator